MFPPKQIPQTTGFPRKTDKLLMILGSPFLILENTHFFVGLPGFWLSHDRMERRDYNSRAKLEYKNVAPYTALLQKSPMMKLSYTFIHYIMVIVPVVRALVGPL